jgi:hypothetical protein
VWLRRDPLCILSEARLVALGREDVVSRAVDDLLGDVGLAARRVAGDDAAGEIQQREQPRDHRDLAFALIGRDLSSGTEGEANVVRQRVESASVTPRVGDEVEVTAGQGHGRRAG